jgi:hypothetical protein
MLAIDELPLFRSSSEILITVALAQCRKFLVRTIACAQGASAFPDGAQDRFLQAFLSLAGVNFFFRHNSELDCSLFGRHIALPVFSPLIEKYRHMQPMQFQEGHRLVELTDTSVTDSESDTAGQSEGNTNSHSDNWNNSATTTINDSEGTARDRQLLRETVSEARSQARAQQDGRGGATSTSQETTVNHSRTTGRSTGISRKQQLVPIIKTVDVCTNVTFFQKEELEAMGATLIANQRVGQAVLHASGCAPIQVTFPYAADPFAICPKFAKKKEAEHHAAQAKRRGFATIEQIQEQRQHLLATLMRRLTAIADERATHAIMPPNRTIAALPSPVATERVHGVILPSTNDPENTPLEI